LLQKRYLEKRKKLEEFIEILEDYLQLEDLYQTKMDKILKNLSNFKSEAYFYD